VAPLEAHEGALGVESVLHEMQVRWAINKNHNPPLEFEWAAGKEHGENQNEDLREGVHGEDQHTTHKVEANVPHRLSAHGC
jgi:hypothetical protein